MTDQKHDGRDDEWVQRAYIDTPAASPASIDATVAAVMAAVRDTTDSQTRRRLPHQQLWRWTPAAAAIAAICIAIVLCSKSSQTGLATAMRA